MNIACSRHAERQLPALKERNCCLTCRRGLAAAVSGLALNFCAAALWHASLAITLNGPHLLLLLLLSRCISCSCSSRQTKKREVCGGATEVLPHPNPGLLLSVA